VDGELTDRNNEAVVQINGARPSRVCRSLANYAKLYVAQPAEIR
jgi:hypothetical protein